MILFWLIVIGILVAMAEKGQLGRFCRDHWPLLAMLGLALLATILAGENS